MIIVFWRSRAAGTLILLVNSKTVLPELYSQPFCRYMQLNSFYCFSQQHSIYSLFVFFHLSPVLIGISGCGRQPCFRFVSIALTEDVITRELSTYSHSGKECWVIEALWLTALHSGHLCCAGSRLSCREDESPVPWSFRNKKGMTNWLRKYMFYRHNVSTFTSALTFFCQTPLLKEKFSFLPFN